jgi:signal transduction histidine kinase/ABC-type uncharacterized transport system substrate-binding protein
VLIVHSFGQYFDPFGTAATAFRTALARQSPDPVEFYEISLETARLEQGEIDVPLAEYVRALNAQHPLDLIVPFGAPAFQFCTRHRDRFFSDVPLVCAAIERRHLEGADLQNNVVAVGFSLDLVGMVEDILHILPATTTVSVIMGSSPVETYWVAEMQRAWRAFEDRVEFTWLNELSLAEMRERVSAMPPHSAIIFGLVNVDAAGIPYEQNVALELLHPVANAPMFGFFESQLGLGLLGGHMTDARSLGAESARIAARILGGESPAALPQATVPSPAPIFDWRQMKRWGILEAQLLPGSEVRFREPTFWQTYRWRILLVGGLCLAQAILIAMLLANRHRLRSIRTKLLENEQNMRLAARAARLGVWTLDLDRERLWITDEGRLLFGWEKTEPLNFERFVATLQPEDRETARRGMRRTLDGNGDFVAENRITLADGSERWIATYGRVEFNGNDKPVCLRGVSLDVTASKRATMEARELRRELNHTDRVSLLGEFTASLAHELGQPLGAILRNADAAELFLKGASPDLDEVRAILADVRRDGERARSVIDRLRAMLRRGSTGMQTAEWRELVDDVMSIVSAEAKVRGITLEIDTPPGLSPVWGDRVQLQQVLLNLVANAMDAFDGSGGERRITVRTRDHGDGGIECAVGDTGSGIAPDVLDGIFDPFVTTKPDGMGMGLPISRTIVEAHGGRLWAENNPGRGATFRFTLPARTAQRIT